MARSPTALKARAVSSTGGLSVFAAFGSADPHAVLLVAEHSLVAAEAAEADAHLMATVEQPAHAFPREAALHLDEATVGHRPPVGSEEPRCCQRASVARGLRSMSQSTRLQMIWTWPTSGTNARIRSSRSTTMARVGV